MPLDVLGAESEGQIGYLLETALSEALPDSEASTALCIAASPADAAHEEQAGTFAECAVAEVLGLGAFRHPMVLHVQAMCSTVWYSTASCEFQ